MFIITEKYFITGDFMGRSTSPRAHTRAGKKGR